MSNAAPTYYRFTYSPSADEVDLSHNWQGHPSTIPYHAEMAGERNEPGLVHGYAYRIGGGWRLTDWESKAISDPHVVSQVIRSLREREGIRQPQDAPGDAWQDTGDPDWDRPHNSLPT